MNKAVYAWRERIGYLKMWGLIIRMNYYSLIIPGFWYKSVVTAFSVFGHISSRHFSCHKDYIFHGQAETDNYLYVYF